MSRDVNILVFTYRIQFRWYKKFMRKAQNFCGENITEKIDKFLLSESMWKNLRAKVSQITDSTAVKSA